MTTTIAQPDTTELAKESSIIVQRAQALEVSNSADFTMAGDELKGIKTFRANVESELGPLVTAAHQQHKALLALREKVEGPAKQAEAIIKRKMGDWQLAERRRAQAEEDRLRAEARKREEDQRLREAEALAAQGQAEAAEAVLDAPMTAPVIVVKPDIPKIKGQSFRATWKHRILDASKIPAAYMIPDEKRIGEHGRSMRDKASISGVEFYEDTTVASCGY